MSTNRERRTNQSPVDLIDGRKLTGLAARYNSLSQDLGGFRERIAPGAFRNVLGCDVRCLLNHDANVILGRTKSGTLVLNDSADGLDFMCLLPDTSAARDIHESVKRGDIDQCSFSFEVGKDNWDEDEDADGNRFARRTITSFNDLFDVSVVVYPAYLDTNVNARAVVAPSVLAEARSRSEKIVRVNVPIVGRRSKPVTDSDVRQHAFEVGQRIATDDARAEEKEHDERVARWQKGETYPWQQ